MEPAQPIIKYSDFDILFIGSHRYNISEKVKIWIFSLFCNVNGDFSILYDPQMCTVIMDLICRNVHSLTKMWLVLRSLCKAFNNIDPEAKYVNLCSVKTTGLLSGILLSNEHDLANAHISFSCIPTRSTDIRNLLRCNLCGTVFPWNHSPDVIKNNTLFGVVDYLQNAKAHEDGCVKLRKIKIRSPKLFDCRDCCAIVRPRILKGQMLWSVCPLSRETCGWCGDKYYTIEAQVNKLIYYHGRHLSAQPCSAFGKIKS